MFAVRMKQNIVALFLLLVLGLISSASAEGEYRKTVNGKTRVWTDEARPGELVQWTGKRDSDGYATGKGTLTWFTTRSASLTGSHIPFIHRKTVSQQTGVMVKGRLSGAVATVDADGKKFEENYANSKQATAVKSASKLVSATPAPSVKPSRLAQEPPAPAEGPTRAIAKPQVAKVSRAPQATPAPDNETNAPSPEMNSSLRSLISPPSLLHVKNEQVNEPAADSSLPKLTATEAINLADAAARSHGYEVGDYQRSPAHYGAAGQSWSVTYERAENGKSGARFSVTVDDKSRSTSVTGDAGSRAAQ